MHDGVQQQLDADALASSALASSALASSALASSAAFLLTETVTS